MLLNESIAILGRGVGRLRGYGRLTPQLRSTQHKAVHTGASVLFNLNDHGCLHTTMYISVSTVRVIDLIISVESPIARVISVKPSIALAVSVPRNCPANASLLGPLQVAKSDPHAVRGL